MTEEKLSTSKMIATFDHFIKETLAPEIEAMTPFSIEWYQAAQAINSLAQTVEKVSQNIKDKFQ